MSAKFPILYFYKRDYMQLNKITQLLTLHNSQTYSERTTKVGRKRNGKEIENFFVGFPFAPFVFGSLHTVIASYEAVLLIDTVSPQMTWLVSILKPSLGAMYCSLGTRSMSFPPADSFKLVNSATVRGFRLVTKVLCRSRKASTTCGMVRIGKLMDTGFSLPPSFSVMI